MDEIININNQVSSKKSKYLIDENYMNTQEMFNYVHNKLNFKTKRRIIVFEVDDYGSIRMPSKAVYDIMIKKGIDISTDRYNRYDSLCNARDLSNLFDVLTSVKDKNGHPAVFTPLTIVSNPDFDRIGQNCFTQYYSEEFPTSLYKYFGNNDAWYLWKQGIEASIFHPQFHGREHLNIAKWMNALQTNHDATLESFKYRFFGLPDRLTKDYKGYMDTYGYQSKAEHQSLITNIIDGLDIFSKTFGYKAVLFTPPNSIFDPFLEKELANTEIKFITRPKFRIINRGNGKKMLIIGFMGRQGFSSIRYGIRTCAFEPNDNPYTNNVDTTLSHIQKSFSRNEPAVISSHRVNFVGNICTKNGDLGLQKLKTLLFQIVKKWPDVEFLSSEQLYNLILDTK